MHVYHTTPTPAIPRDETIGRLLAQRRIDPATGCWLWTGCKSRGTTGYGTIKVNYRQYRVHRLAAHLWNGFDLSAATHILHSCDRPACFNPAHLREGSARENMAAAWRQFHHAGHSPNGHPALTAEEYWGIRRALVSTRTEQSIGLEFGVTANCVNKIRRGHCYLRYSPLCSVHVHAEGSVYELRMPEIILTNLIERYADDEGGTLAAAPRQRSACRPGLRQSSAPSRAPVRRRPRQAPQPVLVPAEPMVTPVPPVADRATAPIYLLLRPH